MHFLQHFFLTLLLGHKWITELLKVVFHVHRKSSVNGWISNKNGSIKCDPAHTQIYANWEATSGKMCQKLKKKNFQRDACTVGLDVKNRPTKQKIFIWMVFKFSEMKGNHDWGATFRSTVKKCKLTISSLCDTYC